VKGLRTVIDLVNFNGGVKDEIFKDTISKYE
jgi:hypothetical protein